MNDSDQALDQALLLTVVLVVPDFLSATKPIAGATTGEAWRQNINQQVKRLAMEGEVWLPFGTRVEFASIAAENFETVTKMFRYQPVYYLIASPQPPPFNDGVRLAQQVRKLVGFDQIIITSPSRELEAAAHKLGMHFILEHQFGDSAANLVTDLFTIINHELQRSTLVC